MRALPSYPKHRPRRRRTVLAGLFLFPILLGCTNVRGELGTLLLPEWATNAYTQEDLRRELRDFSSSFSRVVGATADAITAKTTSRTTKRNALLWRLRAVPLVQEAAFDANPREAFASTLTLMVLMRNYLVDGEASTLFAEQQELAIEACRNHEAELVRIGERFLGSAEMARVQEEIEDFARRHPVLGREFAIQSAGQALDDVKTTGVFTRIAAIPLLPFQALSGVGDSPAAIREFNATAQDFVHLVERLPELMRWQLDLLLYDIEDRETVTESLAILRSLGRSGDQLSPAATRLPADFDAAVADSVRILDQLDRVLRQARDIAGPVRASAQSVELAGASWASILKRRSLSEGTPLKPFDVGDWESAAHEIAEAARELHDLATELSSASNALPQVVSALELMDDRTRGWIDWAAWRIFHLVGASFLLLLAYRWIAARF